MFTLEVKKDGVLLRTINLSGPKRFKTGSRGFNGNEKVADPDGGVLQFNINAIYVGSKNEVQKAPTTAEVAELAGATVLQAEESIS